MNLPKDDVLNAIVTDLVADQVIRALELDYSCKEVEAAAEMGVDHGLYEFTEREKGMSRKARRA